MKKIDLIALDLDGTALNPQNQVSPATADAVRRARESGIHVVVSTGRICGEARDFALMLGTDDQMVTSGGATLSSVSDCMNAACRRVTGNSYRLRSETRSPPAGLRSARRPALRLCRPSGREFP